jgi:hypothetical protein
MRMSGISRRQFLKKSLILTGGLCIPLKVSAYTGPIQCPVCKATIVKYHHHKQGQHAGYYCPNCGVETYSQRVELNHYGANYLGKRGQEHSVPKQISWDCAQIPFPNPNLVKRTTKPAVLLSEIDF